MDSSRWKIPLSQMVQYTGVAVYPGPVVSGASSGPGFQAAINYVAAQYRATGIAYTLYIDAIYYIKILSDWTAPIFIEPNVNIEFALGAYLITDNVCVPAFVFAYTYNVHVLNMHISYQGAGFPIDYTLIAPGQSVSYLACAQNVNAITFPNYTAPIAAWSGATAYAIGNVVTYGGVNYVAIGAGTNHAPPNATYWAVYTGTGGTGSVGPCPDNRIQINTSQTAIWPGPTPYCAVIYLIGNTNNCSFVNLTMDVPPNPPQWVASTSYSIGNVVISNGLYYIATSTSLNQAPPSSMYWNLYTGVGQVPNPTVALPSQFIPWAISGYPNWAPYTSPTGSTNTATYGTTVAPYQLSFVNTVFDGCVMGFNGKAINGTIKGARSYRYADVQNPDGSQIGGMGGSIYAYSAGTTYSKGFTASLSGTNYIYINSTPTTGNSPPNATYWSVYQGTQGYPTANPSCPPPHWMYIQDLDQTYYQTNPQFTARDYSDLYDYGIRCGFQQGTRANSGTNQCLSIKIPVNCDTVIDNVTTLRPDGGIALITYTAGNVYGSLKNAYIVYNSSLQVIADQQSINNTPYSGLCFPSSFPYVYMVLQNITVRDTAASTTLWPVQNISNLNNANCSITGLKVYVPNWTGTNPPGMSLSGTNMEFECQNFFNSYNSTTQSVGALTLGASILQQSRVKIDLYGFRSPSLVWSAVPTGVSGTLTNANGGTTWPFNAGTYLINFSSGETRYGVFPASGSSLATNPITWQMPLMNTTFTFNPAPGNGAMSATLSSTTNLGLSGTMLVTIGGSNQNVVMNWVGTAAIFASALTGTPNGSASIPAVQSQVQTTAANAVGIIQNNYPVYRNRISVIQPNNNSGNIIGAGTGNRVEVNDMTGGYYQIAQNGVTKERWALTWTGTPTAGANTFTIPNMVVPGPASVTDFGWLVAGGAPLNATGGAMTSCGVNLINGTTIPLTNGTFLPSTLGITANTNTGNWSGPISAGGTQRNVQITSNGGNFDGTGIIVVSMVVEMQFATT